MIAGNGYGLMTTSRCRGCSSPPTRTHSRSGRRIRARSGSTGGSGKAAASTRRPRDRRPVQRRNLGAPRPPRGEFRAAQPTAQRCGSPTVPHCVPGIPESGGPPRRRSETHPPDPHGKSMRRLWNRAIYPPPEARPAWPPNRLPTVIPQISPVQAKFQQQIIGTCRASGAPTGSLSGWQARSVLLVTSMTQHRQASPDTGRSMRSASVPCCTTASVVFVVGIAAVSATCRTLGAGRVGDGRKLKPV